MIYYHAPRHRGAYFEGWYLKHQGEGGLLALIPAIHRDSQGRKSASLQVLSQDCAWFLEYPATEFHADKNRFAVHLGQSEFTEQGIKLHIQQDNLALSGQLSYGAISPLHRDIMGPFRALPGMECRHGILSMRHTLTGDLMLNGQCLHFSGGLGYIETDRGRSFPRAYLWTHCFIPTGSIMLSVADIPLPLGHFTGCICAICHRGREYRLATYLGARILFWSERGAKIQQGSYVLLAECPEGCGQPLRSPVLGCMTRTIRECLRTSMRIRFWKGNSLLLDEQTPWGSFEYSREDP